MIPALAYPVIVLISERPLAVAEKTSRILVSVDIGILSPVVNPLDIVPKPIGPVNEGVNVTIAPGIGVKILFGVVDEYS